MRLSLTTVAVVLGLAGALGACQDLDVPNTNAPDRDRALSNPGDVEALIASSWRQLWNRNLDDDDISNVMPLIADEFTGTYANDGALVQSSEPRVAINNSVLSDFQLGVLRQTWEGWYSALSNANEGLAAIGDGLQIVTQDPGVGAALDHTHRARTWATFVQALAHAQLALSFDKAWVISEGTDVSDPFAVPLRPYQEVMDSALVMFEEAIALAQQEEFITPATWIHLTPITHTELQRIMHSYMAHHMILVARTPEERAAVDWDEVLFHLDNGITQDFAPTMEGNLLNASGHLGRHMLGGTNTFTTRADYYLIGPADVSGAYQEWIARPVAQRDKFKILTPDTRITQPMNTDSHGSYFRYTGTLNEIMNPQRGLYHRSYYQFFRNRANPTNPGLGNGRSNAGTWPLLSVVQMELYRAEALFFNGDLQGAADILNVTRNAAGLPDLTTAGVPEDPECVPKLANGDCAGLYDALIYERMIELVGYDAYRAWWDSRGFGRLTEGTFLSIPLPARELITIRFDGDGDGVTDVYTFGGVGGEQAAPRCTRVTLNCLP